MRFFVIICIIFNYGLCVRGNTPVIECKYMTALSYEENSVFGECDSMDTHNMSNKFAYLADETRLSHSYVCNVTMFPNIKTRNVKIANMIGAHCEGMEANKVIGISFDCRVGDMKNQMMQFMPYGIESLFPHLELIRISHCGLQEINSEDLKPFLKLKKLILDGNSLNSIDGDLFKFNRDITHLNLASNDIYQVDPSAFDGLKLDKLEMSGNICIRKEAKSLQKSIEVVKENCPLGGNSQAYKTFFMLFWTVVITTSVYLLIIAAYVIILRLKYQKKVKIEFFSELLENSDD